MCTVCLALILFDYVSWMMDCVFAVQSQPTSAAL